MLQHNIPVIDQCSEIEKDKSFYEQNLMKQINEIKKVNDIKK